MPGDHALLSPSSSSRWLLCTPSARLGQDVKREGTIYTKEGTEAHALGELRLRYEFGKIDSDIYNQELARFKETAEFYNQAMWDYITEYVNFVKEQAVGYKAIYFEQKVLTGIKDDTGTSDTVIVFEDRLTIVDLKYGKGIPVSAEENTQLMIYANGTIRTLGLKNVHKVRLCICQPRIENYSAWETTKEYLEDWFNNYVLPRAELALAGEGELNPGEKQCRFCPVKGSCEARNDLRIKEAKDAFSDCGGSQMDLINEEQRKVIAKQITLEKLSIVLDIAPLYAEWLKDVEAYAYQLAMSGVQIPGYKLVQGRSIRKVDDEKGLSEALIKEGFTTQEFLKEPTLKNIGDLEKLVGKEKFAEISKGFISKPMGKPTLVPEEDKRAPINMSTVAAQVFTEVDQNLIEE